MYTCPNFCLALYLMFISTGYWKDLAECALYFEKIFYWAVIILLAKKNTIINTTISCLLKSRLFWDTTWVLSPWSSNTFLFCNVPYPSKTKRILLSFLLVLFYSMLQRNSLLIKTDYFMFSMQTTIKETNTSNILAKLKVARFPHF